MSTTYTQRDLQRAQMVRLVPGLANMSAEELIPLGFNPAAVQAVAEKAQMARADDGTSTNYQLNGWQVVAKKGIERFYDQIAKWDALSTTISEDYEVVGKANVIPKVEVPIYDNTGEADKDDYSNMDNRDNGSQSSMELGLHKIDDVIEITGRDIEKGVNMQKLIEGSISRVGNRLHREILENLAIGVKQADDDTKAIEGIQLPAVGHGFNFGYVNQELSEAIQPRVSGLLLDATHYGALKAADKNAFNPSDVDVDLVQKVQGLESLGENCVGLLVNERGAALALKAPYMMQGAYASYQQLQWEGSNTPLAICSYFIPGKNCIKIWVGCYVGVGVADVTAIKPLIKGTAPVVDAGSSDDDAA